jgi:hypothetical protein
MTALAIHHDDQPLSRTGYGFWALICAGLGLGASVTTARFFILGLGKLESDALARDALTATGILVQAAADMRRAADIEAGIAPLALELSRLEAGQRPTLSGVLGERGMIAYSVARGLLLTLIGVICFGAAGALLREARAVSTPDPDSTSDSKSNAAYAVSTASPGSTPTLPVKSRFSYGPAALAAMPMTAFSAPVLPVTPAPVPAMTNAPDTALAIKAEHAPEPHPLNMGKVHPHPAASNPAPASAVSTVKARVQKVRSSDPKTRGAGRSTVTARASDEVRYRHVAAAVKDRRIHPSGRVIKAYLGCGQAVAERIVGRLLDDGLIEREGRGYVVRGGT